MWLTARARSGTLPYSLILIAILGIAGALNLKPAYHQLLIVAMCWAVAAIGLDLVSGYLGQPSFGNAAFVGIGAYSMEVIRTKLHLGAFVGFLGMLIVVAIVATVIGLAVVRLKHFSAVLVTFFFAYVVYVLATGTALSGLTNSGGGTQIAPITIGGYTFDNSWWTYGLCLVVLLLVALMTSNYANSRTGRALRLIKESETVAKAMSVPVRQVKLVAFVYSALIAGVAGVLLAFAIGYISPDLAATNQSVILFAMAALGGLGSLAGPIIGATIFIMLPQALQGTGDLGDIVFALIFLGAMMFLPEGLFGILETVSRRIAPLVGGRRQAFTATDDELAPVEIETTESPMRGSNETAAILSAEQVRLEFGGVIALDNASLRVMPGTVHALIGPNGAGKTSLLNCICGLEPGYSGRITLGEEDLRGLGGAAVRQLGITRTFQNPSLVADLSALENVKLGLFATYRWSVFRDLCGRPLTRKRETKVEDLARGALALVGLHEDRWSLLAADLTLGEQKIVDVARAIVGRSALIVLDEPTAGLEDTEVERLVTVVQRLRTSSNLSVLVVAHSIGFVTRVADVVTVMNEGTTFRTGSPSEVVEDKDVVDMFIGREDWGLGAGSRANRRSVQDDRGASSKSVRGS